MDKVNKELTKKLKPAGPGALLHPAPLTDRSAEASSSKDGNLAVAGRPRSRSALAPGASPTAPQRPQPPVPAPVPAGASSASASSPLTPTVQSENKLQPPSLTPQRARATSAGAATLPVATAPPSEAASTDSGKGFLLPHRPIPKTPPPPAPATASSSSSSNSVSSSVASIASKGPRPVSGPLSTAPLRGRSTPAAPGISPPSPSTSPPPPPINLASSSNLSGSRGPSSPRGALTSTPSTWTLQMKQARTQTIMFDVLSELETNLSKLTVAPALSSYLAQAKANVETLRTLAEQLVSSEQGSGQGKSAQLDYSSDPYWKDKSRQIILVQARWRRIIALRKFSALVAKHPVAAKRLHRRRVLEEIIATEKTYVDGLRLGVEELQNPLRAEIQAGRITNITEADVFIIFSNMNSILQCNELLLKEIVDGSKVPGFSVGAVFKKMGPYLRLYAQYVTSREAAATTLAKYREKDFFVQFLEQRKQSVSVLESILITPIQRIPRYVLLLSDLLNNTSDDDPEKAKLEEATNLLKGVAIQINETKRTSDSLQKLVELQNEHQPAFNIVEPHRQLIREGFLSYQVEDESKTETYAYLFSDSILLCLSAPVGRGTIRKTLLSSKRQTALLPLSDAIVDSGGMNNPNMILLSYPKATITVKLLVSDSMNSWLSDISKQLVNIQTNVQKTTIDALKPIAYAGLLSRKTRLRSKKMVGVIRGTTLFLYDEGSNKGVLPRKQFVMTKGYRVKEIDSTKFELIDIHDAGVGGVGGVVGVGGGSHLLQAETPEETKLWVSHLSALASSSPITQSSSSNNPPSTVSGSSPQSSTPSSPSISSTNPSVRGSSGSTIYNNSSS